MIARVAVAREVEDVAGSSVFGWTAEGACGKSPSAKNRPGELSELAHEVWEVALMAETPRSNSKNRDFMPIRTPY